ncbi:MAG: ferrous iron transport protein A [Anaerolineaceae bacterium]|nr:ferrous iron transport protein A [Anaerolineaceae bacterium]
MTTTRAAITLDQLQMGQIATVTTLNSTGLNRRRLLDLGILPGTAITVEMRSPLGDPTAYRVRGSVIALRREQSREIEITLPASVSENE